MRALGAKPTAAKDVQRARGRITPTPLVPEGSVAACGALLWAAHHLHARMHATSCHFPSHLVLSGGEAAWRGRGRLLRTRNSNSRFGSHAQTAVVKRRHLLAWQSTRSVYGTAVTHLGDRCHLRLAQLGDAQACTRALAGAKSNDLRGA